MRRRWCIIRQWREVRDRTYYHRCREQEGPDIEGGGVEDKADLDTEELGGGGGWKWGPKQEIDANG